MRCIPSPDFSYGACVINICHRPITRHLMKYACVHIEHKGRKNRESGGDAAFEGLTRSAPSEILSASILLDISAAFSL